MKIVKPNHEIMIPESPYKHIEKIGRICYKSENYITETSAEPFCKRMHDSNHHAMIEHYRFIIDIGPARYNVLKRFDTKYITMTESDKPRRYIMSASARGLGDMYNAIEPTECTIVVREFLSEIIHFIIKEYDCAVLFDKHFMDSIDEEHYSTYRMHAIKDFSQLTQEVL